MRERRASLNSGGPPCSFALQIENAEIGVCGVPRLRTNAGTSQSGNGAL
jgi:hypothetical protein